MKCIVKQREVDPLKGVEIIGPFISDEAVSAYADANFNDWPFWQASEMTFIMPDPGEVIKALKDR